MNRSAGVGPWRGRRRRGRVALLLVSMAAAASTAGVVSPAGGALALPPDEPSRGLVYRDMRPGQAGGPCEGLFELDYRDRRADGRLVAICTHGPDSAASGVDVQERVPAPPAPPPGSPPPASPGIACYGTGSDGYRVQVLYVRSSDVASQFAAISPTLVTIAAEVDGVVNSSALETGGTRHVRFLTDAACNLSLTEVVLTPTGDDSFSNTISELRGLGYTAIDRKYLTFVDANVYCGVGQLLSDDNVDTTPGANLNNGNLVIPGMVARVDNGCWRVQTATHELFHTLGSVQRSAPNATPGFHCTDEWDTMCYDDDDDGPATVQALCLTSLSFDQRLDCNHDDYYSTAAAGGSYLATHWNSASSAFLTSATGGLGGAAHNPFQSALHINGHTGNALATTSAGATKETGEPNHGGGGGGASVWFRWTPPASGLVTISTAGSTFDTLLGVYTGTAVTSLTTIASNDNDPAITPRSKVAFTAVKGRMYSIAVDGTGGATGTVQLDWSLNGDAPVADFTGNGAAEAVVYRPSTGTWWMYRANPAGTVWGIAGDVPVQGDYNGDGTSDIAVYRPSTGTWFVRGGLTTVWGTTEDIPVPGDYDGDTDTDIAVYRPSTGTWFVRGGLTTVWGMTGDVPVPGDYNGDGTTDIAVYRPSTGTWFVRNGSTVVWGISGDVPVPGDYDGDRDTDIAVYRPSTGTWFRMNLVARVWGLANDIPAPADYDGNGTTDIAVYRPSTGAWYRLPLNHLVNFPNWGTSGDLPVALPDAIRRAYYP